MASRSLAVLSSEEGVAAEAAGVAGGAAAGGGEELPVKAAAGSPTPAVERTAVSFSIV